MCVRVIVLILQLERNTKIWYNVLFYLILKAQSINASVLYGVGRGSVMNFSRVTQICVMVW